MANEFNIKNGYISNGNSIVFGTLTGSTLVISTTPTLNNTNPQVLTRNSTSGNIEYSDTSSPYLFNYGLGNAFYLGNFLT